MGRGREIERVLITGNTKYFTVQWPLVLMILDSPIAALKSGKGSREEAEF